MCSKDFSPRAGAGLSARSRAPRSRAGFSLVEVMVALSVLAVAASIFCQMLLTTTRLRHVNHENVLAADGARVMLERLRNETYLRIYRAYNEDPKDDPGGLGTSPGHLFDVPGLEAVDGAPGGMVGRITFPAVFVEVASGGGGKLMGLGGGGTTTRWELREDYQDSALGMPRDLNGDNVIDTADHALDYFILPVRVELEWRSGRGVRRFEIVTQLADFVRKEDL